MAERNARGWDEGEQLANQTARGGSILKLENDGDKALVIFDWKNLPYSYQSLFRDEEGSLDLSSPEGEKHLQKHPEDAKQARFRARIGLFVLETGTVDDDDLGGHFRQNITEEKLAALGTDGALVEVSKTMFTDIKKLRKKRPFDKYVFEIERNGAPGDKKTTYSLLHECLIDEVDGLEAHITQVEWKDLENPFDNAADPTPGKSPGKPARDKKPSKAKKLTKDEKARLKELFGGENRGRLPALLEFLGVAKMSEMESAMVPRAEEWLKSELAGENESKSEDDDDGFFDD